MGSEDWLERFTEFPFAGGGTGRVLAIEDNGPGVIIVHELPGMIPECLRLGTLVADAGFSVYLPLLFGEPGVQLGGVQQVCIFREWNALAKSEKTPMTDWIRALGREVHKRCGGPGIGAIGMCLTGGFIIPMLLDEHLLAPVASQPSVPWGVRPRWRRSLGFSPDTVRKAAERVERDKLEVLGFRYRWDVMCPRGKFRRLREVFGKRFEGREYPGIRHAVLTKHLVDDALGRTIELLEDRLRPEGAAPPVRVE